ncbi:hypothetical protein Tco_0543016 [Tanacetum coccineum]
MLILSGQGDLMLLSPQHVGFGDQSNPMSNSQLNEKGFVDSGCSRHMSGNIAHLSDFKEFDGGYVTFGGGANGGRITGKGTIKTDKLDFEDEELIRASRLKKVMADKGKKSCMETFAPNDKADYYSGITSITVNGKMLTN